MRILAIDTATEACSAAVLTAECLLGRQLLLGPGAAERVLSLVDEVLAEARVELRSLHAVAFGRGPGGFTGVRLAASLAQGLAFGAGLPVVAISDLQAVALRALDHSPDFEGVVVCNDARMREVYWACYRAGAGRVPEPITPERVGSPASVQLPVAVPARLRGAGTGFAAYPELAQRLGGVLTAGVVAELLPRAQEIARLAVAELQAGRILAPEQAVPTYLRDDVATPPSQD
jgi:tRNA threonylcarbamoyladenosine biosynthesis protein TsaB